ncbi:MAG: AAA family ATPase [Myxococcales bacterium]|nr:AAA family ATPase [Myxococcales bacterium]
MEHLPGYQLRQRLHVGSRFTTWRAERESDRASVILKAPHGSLVPRDIARLRHEFTVSSKLDVVGVVRAQGLEQTTEHGVVLVTEDFGGLSLRDYQAGKPLESALVVSIAIQVAKLLGEVHARGVVHKDIKPASLIIHPGTHDVRLTDFGISSELPREDSRQPSTRRLEGTLAYIAPEQTGRINRPVDARSDLYSLGATLFELLTGRPPFEATDPVEQVHAHIARPPERVDVLEPSVPGSVANVVEKLLSKAAEDRYQSAYGLLHDLERCRTSRTEFPLGERDVGGVLRLPEGLVGRDAERQQLLDSVSRVLEGGLEALMISGPPGIGKSALVAELEHSLAAQRGVLVTGKFEQFQQGLPYSGLVGALAQLAQRLLTGAEAEVLRWRKRLLAAVSQNSGVIVDLIPEFGPLLGANQPSPELGPAEADIRTRVVLRAFLRSLCTADHPVILFLDDLQWADEASLDALKLLLSDHDLGYLLVVGAYREGSVDDSHPLRGALAGLERGGARVKSLALDALQAAHIAQLLAPALDRPPDEVAELAQLVFTKTDGNPFFVRQFISELYRRGIIDFEAASGSWRWNLRSADAQRHTDNVVDLLSARLNKLPAATVEVLAAAGCLGATFPLDLVSRVVRRPAEVVAADIAVAVREELLTPLSPDWKYADLFAESDVQFAFGHDRIQQAAVATVAEGARIEIHLAAGRFLRDANAGVFSFVEHLNTAQNHLERCEQIELAEFNLRAARRALQASAAGPALEFARKGLRLLEADAATSEQSIANALRGAEVEALFRTGALTEMDELVDRLLAQGLPVLDQVALLEMRIASCVSRVDYAGSLEAGFQALELLGEQLPRSPGKLDVMAGLLRTKFALRNEDPARLDRLPELSDPNTRAAMRVMRLMTSAAFFAAPDLFPLIVFRLVRMSIAQGVCPSSAYGFAAYGLLLVAALKDYTGGLAWGDLAVRTVERLDANQLAGPVHLLHQIFIRHWTHPVKDCVGPLEDSAHTALGAGDLEYYSYNLYWNLNHRLWTGESLQAVEEDLARWWSGTRKYKQDKGMLLLHQRHLLDVLRSGPHSPLPDDVSDERLLQRWTDAKDSHGVPAANGYMAMCCFFYGNMDEAARLFSTCNEEWGESLVGLSMLVVFRFYQGLAILGSREPDTRKARAIAKQMHGWAKHCAANAEHRACLLDAEIGRVGARPLDEVLRSYERAVALASRAGYVNDEALANERLGRFLGPRNPTAGRAHLLEARRLYAIWGATAVVARLDAEFPDLCVGRLSEDGSLLEIGKREPTGVDRIDLAQIIKANRTLAEALVLEKVLSTLLQLTMQNAGAQRGVLLLKHDEGVRVEAQARAGDHPVVEPAELEGADLPRTMINYVLRTGDQVVLGDAHRDGVHRDDPYIRGAGVRSVLCSPLQHRGELLGIVYLENNLVPDAFTPGRLETVKLIAGQAGISIRNAQLLARLEGSLAEQVALTTAHSRFVPHQFLQSLNRDRITEVQLGDQVSKEMSIFFSDIRGFTTIVESMASGQALLDFINTYLSHAEPPLLENNGFIDSYSGDGIMALFEDPDSAIQGAIGMQRTLDRYNAARVAAGEEVVATGIGVSTGMITMGTIGGFERIKCGVIGDSVNTSARVESLTKTYGVRVLITEHTLNRVVDRSPFTFRHVDKSRVVGKVEPVTLYQVVDAETEAVRARLIPQLHDYEEALEHYYNRAFGTALGMFNEFLAYAPDDVTAGIFAGRCRRWLREGVPDDWDGVEQSRSK